MVRSLPAGALAAALVFMSPMLPRAEAGPDAATWRQSGTLQALILSLEDWLDDHADWPRRAAAPNIRLVSPWQATARQGAAANARHGRLRGLYDPDRSELLLVRPWNPRDAQDVSVLLHELVHHRQAPHHWYCPGAQELPAHRLQAAWLSEQGLSLEVNWLKVVLDAGCTPRDIHPE